MFGASPYLYLGRERIEHEFKYNDLKDDDKFEEVLDMADEIQSIMVGGVMKILEKEGKELSLDNINNYLRKYSQKLLMHYINVLS
jgi:dsDNA-binding SOS-regulon protein